MNFLHPITPHQIASFDLQIEDVTENLKPHSVGPWSIEDGDIFCGVVDHNGSLICDVETTEHTEDDTGNAALIAAAPTIAAKLWRAYAVLKMFPEHEFAAQMCREIETVRIKLLKSDQ